MFILHSYIRTLMKICLITNLYPPYSRGGAEYVVFKTVKGMAENGHKVVVITTSPDGESDEISGNISIYRFKPRNFFFYTQAHKYSAFMRFLWHIADMFHFGSARYIKRILQKAKPDVVHTHNLMGIGFLIPAVIRKMKIKHLHTVHDVQLVEPSGIILKLKEKDWRYNGLPTKIYTWLMKKLIGSPDVVISPSQFLLDFYSDRGFFEKSKKVMLRNPVTTDQTDSGRYPRGQISFLYLGQIEKHKGINFLIERFIELCQEKNIRAELHIAGDGSEFENIKKMSQGYGNIIMHGKVDRTELPKLFKEADMTIVPSLCYENSPTVIFESLSFGAPVLASRVEGIVELIREGDNGLTFQTGDKESLKQRIMWCLDNKEKLEEMSRKTIKPLAGLSQDDYIRELNRLYNIGI